MAILCGGAGAGAVSFSTSEEDTDVDEVAGEAFLAGGSVGAFSTGLGSSSIAALFTGAGSGSGAGSLAFFSVCGLVSALYLLS